jgi:hypothetical protein
VKKAYEERKRDKQEEMRNTMANEEGKYKRN